VDNSVDKAGDAAVKAVMHKAFSYAACFLIFKNIVNKQLVIINCNIQTLLLASKPYAA